VLAHEIGHLQSDARRVPGGCSPWAPQRRGHRAESRPSVGSASYRRREDVLRDCTANPRTAAGWLLPAEHVHVDPLPSAPQSLNLESHCTSQPRSNCAISLTPDSCLESLRQPWGALTRGWRGSLVSAPEEPDLSHLRLRHAITQQRPGPRGRGWGRVVVVGTGDDARHQRHRQPRAGPRGQGCRRVLVSRSLQRRGKRMCHPTAPISFVSRQRGLSRRSAGCR
jgi:hypothetical protein